MYRTVAVERGDRLDATVDVEIAEKINRDFRGVGDLLVFEQRHPAAKMNYEVAGNRRSAAALGQHEIDCAAAEQIALHCRRAAIGVGPGTGQDEDPVDGRGGAEGHSCRGAEQPAGEVGEVAAVRADHARDRPEVDVTGQLELREEARRRRHGEIAGDGDVVGNDGTRDMAAEDAAENL